MTISHKRLRIIYFFLIISATHSTIADIYKCRQDDGTVQFSDATCPDGKAEVVAMQINSALDSSEERENIRIYNVEKNRHHTHRRSSKQIQLISDIRTEEHNKNAAAKINGKHKIKQRRKTSKSHVRKTKTGDTEKT